MKPRSGTDEWIRRQKNCTKMIGAHFRPHCLEDERLFVVLKYTETPGNNQVSKTVFESKDTVQTNNNGQL